jgi:hypothetical protein
MGNVGPVERPSGAENVELLSLMAMAEANPEVQATLPQHAAG